MMLILLFLFSLFVSPLQAAVDSEECFNCHEAYKKKPIHGDLPSCTSCHSDIKSIPHDEKLARPACANCHKRTANRYARSVHQTKGLACKNCHEVHAAKEKQDCGSCHRNVAHKTLPSREKHLATLNCVACHGVLDRSRVEVTITLPKGATLERKVIDRDGNGFVDPAEWHALEGLLDQRFKGSKLERQYWADSNAHEIGSKPAACGECHEKRSRFATAVLRIVDTMAYSLQLSPSVFIPEFPPLTLFGKTVHGQKGVRCVDCHISQKKIEDTVCLKCHKEVYHTYRGSIHAKKGATSCTDCHNPHRIKSYKELGAKERIAVCSRCHKDYIAKHEWLPNTTLHFDYLECTTCHSPGSEKSMVFFFSKKTGKKEGALNYEDVEKHFGSNINLKTLIDQYAEKMVKSDEIGPLLVDLKKSMGENVFIDAEIIVTKVHHDYSVTRLKEKECVTCHSAQAHFYNSMYLNLPGKEKHIYVPVKGTVLSAYPIGMAIDFYLLGEEKISKKDLSALLGKGAPGQAAGWRSLGFKLIDLGGVLLLILVLLGLSAHVLLRILVKR